MNGPASGRSRVAGWWLVVVVGAALVMPRLSSPGGYSDGLLYASIARNLTLGIGTWWEPSYTETLFPRFHEHPPLMLILTSGFFAVLGDRFWTERAFSLCVLAAGLVAMRAIWRRAAPPQADLAWVPALLWLTLPLTVWLTSNHMLELPVSVAALAAVWAILRARDAAAAASRVAWLCAGGVAIVAGFLVKGPFALFPLVAPLALALPHGRRAVMRGMVDSALLAAAVAIVGGLVLLHDGIRANIAQYLQQQVMASLSGARGAHAVGRWNLVRELSSQLWPVAVPALAVAWLAGGRRLVPIEAWRDAAGWLLVALSASLPLLASPRHAPHYLGGCLPFFALALAAPVAALLAPALERVAVRWPRIDRHVAAVGCIALAAIAALGASVWGVPRRDRQVQAAIAAFRPHLPPGTVVGGGPALGGDYRMHAYLQRYLRVSIDSGEGRHAHAWWIGPIETAPPGAHEVAASAGCRLFAVQPAR